jgi:uncharacterized protein YraI
MKTTRILWLLLALLAVAFLGVSVIQAQDEGPVGTVNAAVVNVRSGPSTAYPIITQATRGSVYRITGRNAAGTWWQVCCVRNRNGWIWARLLTVKGDTSGVPVVPAPPRPTPRPSPRPQPTPTPTPPAGWRGEYFSNKDLRGTPAFVRYDPQIYFRWGTESPGGNLPATNFSVRWTQVVSLAAGDYRFFAQVDDGVRLYLDGHLVINAWRDSPVSTQVGVFEKVGPGQHTITVEYYQASGDAIIIVWWERVGDFPEWRAEYFNDIYLEGPPLLVRNEPAIDFNWGLGSPDPRVPTDNWSARWTRCLQLDAGHYDFFARTADGVRIYLDGWPVLNHWYDSTGYDIYQGWSYQVQSGTHCLIVEYYARGGIAYAQVWWTRR